MDSNFDIEDNDILVPIGNVRQSFWLNQGDAVFFEAGGTTTSSNAGSMMDQLQVDCGHGEDMPSTHNHVGTGPYHQIVRWVFMAPSSSVHTCWLMGRVKPDQLGEPEGDIHTYLSGSETTLRRVGPYAGSPASQKQFARWGTENDNNWTFYSCAYPGSDLRCTYVGQRLDPGGSASYLLRSPRLQIRSDATSFTVWSEPELTVCYHGTASCTPATWGEIGESQDGSDVRLTLFVDQMCSPTSATVGKSTASSEVPFPITSNEHHKKAHLRLSSLPIETSCPSCADGACNGRTFMVKTWIRHLGGNPTKVEYGSDGHQGYSTSFAIATIPTCAPYCPPCRTTPVSDECGGTCAANCSTCCNSSGQCGTPQQCCVPNCRTTCRDHSIPDGCGGTCLPNCAGCCNTPNQCILPPQECF